MPTACSWAEEREVGLQFPGLESEAETMRGGEGRGERIGEERVREGEEEKGRVRKKGERGEGRGKKKGQKPDLFLIVITD